MSIEVKKHLHRNLQKHRKKNFLSVKMPLNDRPNVAVMQRGDPEDGQSDGGIPFLAWT